MRRVIRIMLLAVSGTLFFSLCLNTPVRAFLIESTVSENGIALEYNITSRVQGSIAITPETPWELNIAGLVYLQISINRIDPNPQAGFPHVMLRFYLETYYPSEFVYEKDLTVPFGEWGIETRRRDRIFKPIDESNQIDISILSTANKLQYAMSLNFGEAFNDRWEGKATIADNIITEEVVIDAARLADFFPGLPLPPDLPREIKWELTLIPVFTVSPLSVSLVKLNTYHDGSLISSIPADFPYFSEFLAMLPLPLLKGNMHFWFNAPVME